MKLLKDKKVVMTVLSIILVLVVMSSTTYALFFKVHTMDNTESYTAGILEITVEEGTALTLNNTLPMTDEGGAALTPYTFKVTNTGNLAYTFDLKILSTTSNNQINPAYIKVKLDDKESVTLSSLSEGLIANDLTLNPSESITMSVRIWLSIDTPNTEIGKNFSAKIVTDGVGSEYVEPSTGADYIESLLSSNPDTMNNDDPDGNVRYMGKNPNNYVDIGDKYPEGFTVGKWEELGASFQTADECREHFNCSVNYESLGFSSEEECNTELPPMLESEIGVSSVEEFNNTYCVVEDWSNEPILWRIIGVFDVASTENGPTEKRLKIIRNKSIGSYSWDSGNVNDWSKASLQTYLNGEYYNSINQTSQNLIGNTYWNLGGTGSYTSASNGLASHFYGYERGTTVYSGRPTGWVGKIGLMYPSDYGYATSGGTTTNRASCLAKEMYNWDSSSYSDCKNNDYLFDSSIYQWTITPYSSSSDFVFGVNSSGFVGRSSAGYSSSSASPVLYLKSTVEITGGEGTSSSPYTLG